MIIPFQDQRTFYIYNHDVDILGYQYNDVCRLSNLGKFRQAPNSRH